jgi:hypothetical protein
VIVDTAEFARIADTAARIETLEARVGAMSAALEAAHEAAGMALPWRPGPRHARPRGHLRLVQGGRG